jgi:hypothetical protein
MITTTPLIIFSRDSKLNVMIAAIFNELPHICECGRVGYSEVEQQIDTARL